MCWGGRQVFSIFVFVHTNQKFAPKNKENTITCDIVQNASDKNPKNICCNPPLDQKLEMFNLHFLKDKQCIKQKTREIKKMRQKPGTKRKQQIKTRRKEEKKETEQENVKEGGRKRRGGVLRRKKGRHSKIHKNAKFYGEKLL